MQSQPSDSELRATFANLGFVTSTVEVLSLEDLENGCRLCAAFATRVTADSNWTP